MTSSTAIIILAAGFSKRLGKPKQMLQLHDQTLLQHTIEAAQKSGAFPIIVVTNELIQPPPGNLEGTFTIQNEEAKSGMSTSIKTGIELLVTIAPDTEFVIISVCDQPYISPGIFELLSQKQAETSLPLVASSYGDSFGTPALLHKSYFGLLMELSGDSGAKKIMQSNLAQTATISFPLGMVDIDTAADWERFEQQS